MTVGIEILLLENKNRKRLITGITNELKRRVLCKAVF
jgi:hypothetical protein